MIGLQTLFFGAGRIREAVAGLSEIDSGTAVRSCGQQGAVVPCCGRSTTTIIGVNTSFLMHLNLGLLFAILSMIGKVNVCRLLKTIMPC